MTNRELLKVSPELLSGLDKQRLFLLRVESTPGPCPACKRPVNALEAAGIDLDAYDFGATRLSYRCPNCLAELEQILPLFPGGPFWHWGLKHTWLEEQLRKAKAFDQQGRPGTGEGRP
jgi:hypothetical protein